MKKIVLIVSAFFIFTAGPAWAAWFDLTEEQMQEALEHGQSGGKNLSIGSEWAVSKPDLKGWVEIRTPFKAIAEFVRNNLRRKRFASSELKKVAASVEGVLSFTYYHYKLDDAFTQSPSPTGEYYAFLRIGDQYIYPLRYTTGTQFRDISLNFTFPVKGIKEDAKIRFIFREPSGYQRDFIFDLEKIR